MEMIIKPYAIEDNGKIKKYYIRFDENTKMRSSLRYNVEDETIRWHNINNYPNAIGYAFDSNSNGTAIKRGECVTDLKTLILKKYSNYYDYYTKTFYKVKIRNGG